jgi:ribosomal protein S18 acetylase RimI-like enzyme
VSEPKSSDADVSRSGNRHHAVIPVTVRAAAPEDEAALTALEEESWLPHVSPAVYRERPFFETTRPEDVLVATLDGRIVGYATVRPATPLLSNAHVLAIEGLGVSSTVQRQGVAGRLLDAVEEYAVNRNVERLTLRVLAVNEPARALYERHGYRTEGVLHGEFRLPVGPDGSVIPVDDVLMAKAVGKP